MDDNTLKAIDRICKTIDFFERTPRNQDGSARMITMLDKLIQKIDPNKSEQRTGDSVV